MLVWSEAWSAKGEKGKNELLFQAYAYTSLRADRLYCRQG
jgi:hypothetical protein